MSVEEILSKGFYRQGQTLTIEDWVKISLDWRKYALFDSDSREIEWIKAKDDETAMKAFSSLYYLEEIADFQIVEKVVTYRNIFC